jgi:hypothetical protein
VRGKENSVRKNVVFWHDIFHRTGIARGYRENENYVKHSYHNRNNNHFDIALRLNQTGIFEIEKTDSNLTNKIEPKGESRIMATDLSHIASFFNDTKVKDKNIMTTKEYCNTKIKYHEQDKKKAYEICKEIVRIFSEKQANQQVFVLVKNNLDKFVLGSTLDFVECPFEYF